jgi:hypothetical protein
VALVCACACLAAAALAQVPTSNAPASNDLLHGIDHVLGRGDRAPTIDDVLGDVLGRLQGLDKMSAQAAAGRLRESERELALYETLLKQVRGGLLVDVPNTGGAGDVASPEAVALERRKVGELARQLREAEAARQTAAASRPAEPVEKSRPSRIADALLDVVVDVPSPPVKTAGAATALDAEGLSRALFAAGDYAGTIDAIKQIPDAKLAPADRYRRARSLDQLGRIAEAKAAYEAVVAADKDGPYGRQAAWMLKLARTREQVSGALGKTEAKGREEKPK